MHIDVGMCICMCECMCNCMYGRWLIRIMVNQIFLHVNSSQDDYNFFYIMFHMCNKSNIFSIKSHKYVESITLPNTSVSHR